MFHNFKSSKIKRGSLPVVLILFIAFIISSYTLHKEYYSITNIDYSTKEKSLQISMRLFTNDMELELHNYYNRKLELGTEIEDVSADSLIVQYVNHHFRIDVNDTLKSYTFVGKEYEKDVVFLYFEATDVDKISKLKVKNAMLIASFPEQENWIKIQVNDVYKSMHLTKSYTNDIAFF